MLREKDRSGGTLIFRWEMSGEESQDSAMTEKQGIRGAVQLYS